MQYKKLSTLNMVASHCANNINFKKQVYRQSQMRKERVMEENV
jgi:hypothetical protein